MFRESLIVKTTFDILKLILGYEACGNEPTVVYYSLLRIKMISFVLCPKQYSLRTADVFPVVGFSRRVKLKPKKTGCSRRLPATEPSMNFNYRNWSIALLTGNQCLS